MSRQHHSRRRLVIFAITTVCLFALMFSVTSIWSEDDHEGHAHGEEGVLTLSDKAKANIGLKTTEADLRPIESIVHVTGDIIAHPGRQAIVTPRVGGIVRRIHFSLGDSLKQGDVLLELESLDLQTDQIQLIEAANLLASLLSTLANLKAVSARKIRLELQNRQIDYLESLSDLSQQKTVLEQLKALAVGKITAELERMRFALVKADVELGLMETRLKRIEALAEKRISAQKELVERQAEYAKGKSDLAGAKRQFHLLGIGEQTVEKILGDGGETSILTLLGIDDAPEPLLEKYVVLIEEATGLVDAEAAYKAAAIKVSANKQRVLAVGLSEEQINALAETASIATFADSSPDELLDNYIPLLDDPGALVEAESAHHSAVIALNTLRQKLQTFGLTTAEMDKIQNTGEVNKRFHVIAPASGQIAEQQVTLGATVEKSNTLFSILDTDIVWVEGDAYEDTLAKIQVASDVRIRLAAYPETVFTGTISRVSDILESEKRKAHFWIEVANPDHKLKPGMFAELTVVTQKTADVLCVPLTAVLEDGPTRFVFVEEGSAFAKREIVVGAEDDRYVEVKDGLFPGDIVVVRGNYQLMTASTTSSQITDPHAGHSH